MTLLSPTWLQAGSYSAEGDRQVITAFGIPAGNGTLHSVTGVLSGLGGELAVSAASPAAMAVTVAAGSGLIGGTYTTDQGTYQVTNDSVVTIPITAADPTNPRIDVLSIQVLDPAYAGTASGAQFTVTQGTPATSPQAPAAPPVSLVLGQIYVGAGATSIASANITDYRTWSGARGEHLRCTSSTRPAYPYMSQRVYETDTFLERRWDGANWGVVQWHGTDRSFNGAPIACVAWTNAGVANNSLTNFAGWTTVNLPTIPGQASLFTYTNGPKNAVTVNAKGRVFVSLGMSSDAGYAGSSAVSLYGPQNGNISNVYDEQQRASGYSSAGSVQQYISTVVDVMPGDAFGCSVTQINTGGITVTYQVLLQVMYI